jgi:hypothetical protein
MPHIHERSVTDLRMPTRSTVLASAALGLSLAGAGMIAAPAAVAHTPAVSVDCDTLSVELTAYDSSGTDSTPNTVTVSIDGTKADSEQFGREFSRAYLLGDNTRSHSYEVVVDAEGTAYDKHFIGSSNPCPAPAPVKDAAAAVAVTPATCDSPGRLVLGDAVNAVWDSTSAVVGPADYSVTATARKGHVFPDGKTTAVFTGTVQGLLDQAKAPCATPTPTPEKPEPSTAITTAEFIDCTLDEVQTTTTTTTTGHVLNEAGTGWTAAAPVVVTKRSTKPATDQACPVEAAPELPAAEVPAPVATKAVAVPVKQADTLTSTPSLPAGELASTGASVTAAGIIGGFFLLTGLVAVLGTRTRKA